MTSSSRRRIVVLGHSHLVAIARSYEEYYRGSPAGAGFQIKPVQLRNETFQPNIFRSPEGPALNHMIVRRVMHLKSKFGASEFVSCVMGNEYNAVALLNHPRRFDFFLPETPAFLPDPTAEMIPVGQLESLLRSRLDETVGVYLAVLSKLTGSLVHYPPPPPVPDSEHIASYPGQFGERVEQFGVSPAPFRLKMWKVNCRVQQSICKRHGVLFRNLPAAVFDEDGFLARKYWNNDPTHGNLEYGKLIVDDIVANPHVAHEQEAAVG